MVLTDELFEKGKHEIPVRECLPIDENYVLIKKSMPCTDAELDEYIENIKKAHEAGINTPRILDYRLIEGTTTTFDKDDGTISYTVGIFLEERAKGVTISSISRYLKTSEDYLAHLNSVESYVSELEKRANADQSMYDKFVADFIDLNDFNLSPDPKPTNFFFSDEYGFTIIDVVDQRERKLEYIPQYIIMDTMGYGLPQLIDEKHTNISFLSQTLSERYNVAKKKIFEKSMIALKKRKIPKKYIKAEFEYLSKNYTYNNEVIPDDKVEEYINTSRSR